VYSVTRPNILIVIADDLGYGDPACYGHPTHHTPNLDRLAAEGIRCRQFLASNPICSPARASLFTGLYPQRVGIEGVVSAAHHRDVGMSTQAQTLWQDCKDAGYRTALFGKWHLGYSSRFHPNRFGCEEFRGYLSGNVDYHNHVDQAGHEDWWKQEALSPDEGYVTDLITDYAENWISRDQERPFCCVVAHAAPHYPYQGREDPAYRTLGSVPKEQISGIREDIDRAYREMLEAYDQNVGRLLDLLDRQGLADNTVVIVTGDHGAPMFIGTNGSLREGKTSLYQGGIQIPTWFRWPSHWQSGVVCDEPISGMDISPTLHRLIGAPADPGRHFDGCDLHSVLSGASPSLESTRTLCWSFREQAAVRRDTWKMYRSHPDAHWELYDLTADPGECRNLADTRPELLKEMEQAFTHWQADIARHGPVVA